MKYRSVLEHVKTLLDPRYSQTRCPVCIFVVDVDGNGNMVEHGSGFEPCTASGRNDEEVADELDRTDRRPTDEIRD